MTGLLFMFKYTVLYMQYCCNSTVATAGVLNVRAKRLLPQRAPPCPPQGWKNCFSPAVPPQRAPPKSGKTVSHQPCPPPNLKKTVFHRSSGYGGDGVTCDQQIPRFARTKVCVPKIGLTEKAQRLNMKQPVVH